MPELFTTAFGAGWWFFTTRGWLRTMFDGGALVVLMTGSGGALVTAGAIARQFGPITGGTM